MITNTLKATAVATLFLLGVAAMPLALAERPDHFQGEDAATLEQAVENFVRYNEKLRTLLDKDDLTARELGQVHQLTYTLENALAKINEEFQSLAETLEEVHLASEEADAETVRRKGQRYLSTSGKVVR